MRIHPVAVPCAALFLAACGPASSDVPPAGKASSAPTTQAAPPAAPVAAPPVRCVPHVELQPASVWAAEMGRTEAWILANHRIRLWQSPSPSKGRLVGEMIPGSRAVILEERGDDYRVRSPLDGSEGWIGKVQVAGTRFQDIETRDTCTPAAQP